MIVLVINAGSSSLKYQLFDSIAGAVLAQGSAMRIGEDGSSFTHVAMGKPVAERTAIPTHREAFAMVLEALLDPEHGALQRIDQVDAVGHRAVHGADVFVEPALVTPEVLEKLEACVPLAHPHTPRTSSASERRSARFPACRTWPSSTRPSTRRSRSTRTCTRCRWSSARSTASASTASTVRRAST